MKITGFETFLANAGLRNYLFIRLSHRHRPDGHRRGHARVAGADGRDAAPRVGSRAGTRARSVRHRGPDRRNDSRPVPGRLDRDDGDQRRRDRPLGLDRQGVRPAGLSPAGRTMPRTYRARTPTAGMAGRERRPNLPSGRETPSSEDIARSSSTRLERPGKLLTPSEADLAVETVAAVRKTVGSRVGLMIEFHGRLAAGTAAAIIRRLEPFDPAWCEEPVAPECSRSAGRGETIDPLPDRRRREALYTRRFLPLDGPPRGRRRADGPRPLRRNLCRQEDRRHGRTCRTCRSRLIARSGPSLWRPVCILM